MPANGDKKSSRKLSRAAQLLGIEYPIVQAPFGGLPSQRLSAAVSNLGGLGSVGAVTLSSSAIRDVSDEIRSFTDKPFAINLWVSSADLKTSHIGPEAIEQKIRAYAKYYAELGIEPPSQLEARFQNFEAQVKAAIDARVPVLSFIYGVPPSEILNECRSQAIRTIGTATTPEEAVALERTGIDLIVASGFEGGGHRGSFLRPPADSLMGSFSLIPQVADAVEVPVIAAGGIGDGRGLMAALVFGAEGGQIGTAFLPCAGSGVSAPHREALLSRAGKRTDLTDDLTGRLARGIANRLMNELNESDSPPLPFPLQYAVIQTIAGPASKQERGDLMPLWAGQSVDLCHHTQASDLMAELIASADLFFGQRSRTQQIRQNGKRIPQRASV
jgi:nitronate monooxygenase